MQAKLITGLIIILCSGTSYADYGAENLDTLFTDKSQRARIDAARSGNNTGTDLPQQTSKVSVSGYMKRSDGKNVVWVNGENTLEGSKIGYIKVQQSNIGKNKKVGITVDGTHVHLKPGETWSKETGKAVDNY
jgi:hypothetical protein